MKILMSAYACLPNVGSEPGIGWRWATEAAKLGHEVTVITRESNRADIEKALSLDNSLEKIAFEYYDLPNFYQWQSIERLWPTKVGLHFFWHIWHYPYHYFWQKGVFKKAKGLVKNHTFDAIHHITFGTIRRSSSLWKLDKPFIFGPVGGGERAPFKLRKIFTKRAQLNELARDLSILSSKLSLGIRDTCKNAEKIYLKTPDSMYLVPKAYRTKAEVKLEIGIENPIRVIENNASDQNKNIKILYVGRFLYWKGMDYGLRAFAQLVEKHPHSELTMVGKGPDEDNWKKLAAKLEINNNIKWVQWVDQKELSRYYQDSDIFLFPSLHDSSGNVVLESISHGLPVVCLNLGGPAAIVDDSCAVRVDVTNKTANQVVKNLADSLLFLSNNREELSKLKEGALEKSKKYIWSNVVATLYNQISEKKC